MSSSQSDDDASVRPDFTLLFCPVISMQSELTEPLTRRNWLGATPTDDQIVLYSAEMRVCNRSIAAPAFVGHAIDDTIVPIASSRAYTRALHVNHVPVQLHEMPSGGHDLDRCSGPRWNAMLDSMWAFAQRIQVV